MKRLYLWLRELSLSQQLLTIAFLLVTVFAVFLLAFLTPQIDLFSETEMFRMLHNSQNSMEYYLAVSNDYDLEIDIDANEIVHALYDTKTNTYHFIGNGQFS